MESNSEVDTSAIRLGELHVVFTVFKILRKFMDGNGLNKAFEETLSYGSNTVVQTKDGWSPSLIFITIQVIYSVTDRLISINIKELEKDIINDITISENSKQESKESLREKFISSVDFVSQNLMNNY